MFVLKYHMPPVKFFLVSRRWNAWNPSKIKGFHVIEKSVCPYLPYSDDLGRVVIPKEIRRTMRIREGDPPEIYTNSGGEVIFKKYSPIGELSSFASQYADALTAATDFTVLICDRDHCIAASGISKKEVLERRVTQNVE